MSACVCRWFPVIGWGQWVAVEFMPCNHGTHYPISRDRGPVVPE